jgi:FOG: Ankyrin repeat
MCFKDKLKSAICNNDIEFLNQNREKYSIDDRFDDEDDNTLLLYSISDSKSCVYEYFLKNNADVYLLNNEGENILHAIVYSGDSRRLEKVMYNYKIDIDFQANDSSTPLLLAISLEHFKMADLLIKYGANVNIADVDGITPLHLSVQF